MSTTMQAVITEVTRLKDAVQNENYEVTVADLESLIAMLGEVSGTDGSGGPGEENPEPRP